MSNLVFKELDLLKNNSYSLILKYNNKCINLCSKNQKVKTRNNPKRKGRVYND